MKEGTLLYFTEEEFALLLDFAGGDEYLVLLTQDGLDDRRLPEALVRLYQRGFLVRTQDSFALSKQVSFFHDLRNAEHIVLLHCEQPEQKTVLCYVQNGTVWLAELLGRNPYRQYRVCKSNRTEQWLLDAEFLPRPFLQKQDSHELELLFADELEKAAEERQETARVEKYSSQGVLLCSYTIFLGGVGLLMEIQNADGMENRIYTADVLRELLQECFGGCL